MNMEITNGKRKCQVDYLIAMAFPRIGRLRPAGFLFGRLLCILSRENASYLSAYCIGGKERIEYGQIKKTKELRHEKAV